MTLTARRCSRLGIPTRDRIRRKPDGQAPAITKGRVIFAPIRDPMTLTGNVPPAFRMKFEGMIGPPTRKSEAFSASLP